MISNNDKLHFLISISGGKLSNTTTLEQARNFWYKKPRYHDIYDAVANIPYDRTFARTVRGIGNNPTKTKIVSEGKSYVASRLRNLNFTSQSDFDDWHRECVLELISIFSKGGQTLHIGQGQKWVNMALKHLWLADEKLTKDIVEYFHIPLDNYLYDALSSSETPENLRGIELPFGPKKCAWSKIDNYDAYLKFQKDFRARINVPPLECEFYLWQKQKDLL